MLLLCSIVLPLKFLCGAAMVSENLPDRVQLAQTAQMGLDRVALALQTALPAVLPFAGEKPPTARQLNLPASDGGLPMVLINDGRLLERHLRQRGFDRVWLEKRLAEHGVRSPREVYLLSVDEQGQVYFVPKEAVGR